MCRWMAWSGQPVLLDDLLFKPEHGLVDQSLHSRMGAETTNGDGFGVGWYGTGDGPGVFHSVAPAWGDANLRSLAAHIESPLVLAHVRATSGTAVQETNCHPFRHGRWLFVHNGVVADFPLLRRDLALAIAPERFAALQGSTDSEVLFLLALTLGLEDDPIGALERTIGLAEATARAHGLVPDIQASIGVSDGETLWAVRYSTVGASRTLFASADVEAIRRLHPHRALRVRDGDRLVVSEPLVDLPGAWHELPEATAATVPRGGEVALRAFTPADATAAAGLTPSG
jgi:predicted glutamine amidotransferase